jgi:hypothetical protein
MTWRGGKLSGGTGGVRELGVRFILAVETIPGQQNLTDRQ